MSEILEYLRGQKDTRLKIREELVELSKQNIVTQPKKAEELTAKHIVFIEAIKMMGHHIFDLGMENKVLRDKLGDINEKWLIESKNKKLLDYDREKKKQFIMTRRKRQNQKLKAI